MARRRRTPRMVLVVAVFKDQGISGAKGRDKRPGLDNDVGADQTRNLTWSAARSSIAWVDRCWIDTTTPSGKAMFQMMGVFAEFERSIIHERVMAGLAEGKGRRNSNAWVTTDRDHAERYRAKVRAIQSDRKAGKSLRKLPRRNGSWPYDRRTNNCRVRRALVRSCK